MQGWGIIGGAPSGGFTKVAIKARLLNSFAWKETKTKKVQLYTKWRCTWKFSASNQTRNRFNSLRLSSQSMFGINECLIHKKKPDFLKTLT